MSEKIRFTLRAEPLATDPKTTVPVVYSMQFMDDDNVYIFHDEHKSLIHHDRLMSIPIAMMAKKDLLPRWQTRSFKVTLPPDIASLYSDVDGNPVFLGKLLNQLVETSPSVSSRSSSSTETVAPAPRPLSSIVKDAVISKFGSCSSASNAEVWIEIFETECRRLGIEQNCFWEVIRLFVEDAGEKWYMTTRLSSNSTSWEFWKNSFIENFGQRGLSAARSAFAYRFIGGSLSDYAQTKLNLLVSFNPKMHELDKMAHLALGLPSKLLKENCT